MRLFSSTGLLFLIVIALQIQNSVSRELRPSSSRNEFSAGRRSLEEDKGPSGEQRREGQALSSTFVKNLNEALMKFLRDVTEMVKESPHDAEQIRQSDVEKIIANSLISAVSERTTSATSTSSTRSPTTRPVAPIRPAYYKNLVRRRRPPPENSFEPFVPLEKTDFPRQEAPSRIGKGTWELPTRSQESSQRHQKNVEDSAKESLNPSRGEKEHVQTLEFASNKKPFSLRHISKKKPPLSTTQFVFQSGPNQNGHQPSNFGLGQIRVEPTHIKEKRLGEGVTSRTAPKKTVKEPLLRNKYQIQVRPALRPQKRYGEARPWRTLTRGNFQGFQATNANSRQLQTRDPRARRRELILQERRSSDVSETITRPQNRHPHPINKLASVSRPYPVRRGNGAGQRGRAVVPSRPQVPRGSSRASAAAQLALLRTNLPRGDARQKVLFKSGTEQIKSAHTEQRPRTTTPLQVSTQLTTTQLDLNATHSPESFRVPQPSPTPEPASSVQPPVTDTPTTRKHNASTPRERILNNMLFDVFARMGVQSFVMRSDDDSLHGVADPSHTHFVPDQVEDGPISNRLPTRRSSSAKRTQQFEEEDLRVVVSGAQRKTSETHRSQRPPFGGQRLAVRNPVFFRNNSHNDWKSTTGVTRRELRTTVMKKA